MQKVAVVGGGVIGLTIGLHLQQQGHQVTIFDKQGPAEGCSKGNAGHIATEQVFPLATPSLLLQIPSMLFSSQSPLSIRWRDVFSTLPWMIRFLFSARKRTYERSTKAISSLNQSAVGSWYRLLEPIHQQELIKMDGSLLVFESDALFQAYQATLSSLEHCEVEYEVWDKKQLRKRLPKLGLQVRHGVFFPNTGHTLEPYEMCLAIEKAYSSLGGEFVQKGVEKITPNAEIQTSGTTLAFDNVVIAAGVHSGHFVESLTGIKVPIQAERGYHVMVDDHQDRLPIPVSSADRKFIMTPMKYGLRLAGTVEYAGSRAPFNDKRTRLLAEQGDIMLQDGIDKAMLGEEWMGCRPTISDSLPVIDSICDGNILLAFGHQHLGLTHAAITAELMGQMIEKQATSLNVAPFTLRRFS
ncbi:NAD(P)/FAD-dependent oxidoreductase [Vibrio nomapromontoriensis]|uniref:NAD(P)/FAD-dependent oxidoreductase n=1 Tax=Vibrio nomapromontoriensis TaxID=2910246 RepID=UPI003D0A684C